MKNKYLILSIVLIISGMFFVVKLSDKFLIRYKESYNKELDILRDKATEQKNIEDYNKLIKIGKSKFEKNDFEEARRFFQRALVLNPNGKNGNFELTKCLIHQCNLNELHCIESQDYYNKMINSKKLNNIEIETLKNLRK